MPAAANLATIDQPPPGWFLVEVMRAESRKWDWVALVVDVHPDNLKNCTCDFPAAFYIDPKKYRPGSHKVGQCWVRIPGKHRNRDAAWGAFQAMMTTRH